MDKTAKQIGIGLIAGGLLMAAYGARNVLGYVYRGDIAPLFFGHTPMPFSSACLWVFAGMMFIWIGWDKRRTAIKPPPRSRAQANVVAHAGWKPEDVQKLIGGIVTILTTVLMIWAGIKK